MQFAGLRTDLELRPIGDEQVAYVRLPDDVVPDPEATLVTGITPQLAQREGQSEWRALRRINELFSQPGTCVAGYNNLRFDDEFIRFGLYRNLLDPYAREWRDGNSRWDLIDLGRAAGALRPEGIEWPEDEQGAPIYTLEALAAANGLQQGRPHDALCDVQATVALARLLRQRQPKLFSYFFAARLKTRLRQLLEPYGARVCVHISGRYPRRRRCFAPVASICAHPVNANAIIVADLSEDLEPLLNWPAERIRDALYGTDAAQRPALKEVRLNRSPFLAPLSAIRAEDAARLGFDADAAERRRQRLAQPEVAEKVRRVYELDQPGPAPDVEAALYDSFIDDQDRSRCAKLQRALAQGQWLDLTYQDPRLAQLAKRLKARSLPEQLSADERQDWLAWVGAKITAQDAPWRTLETAQARLRQLEAEAEGDRDLLKQLSDHFRRLKTQYCD